MKALLAGIIGATALAGCAHSVVSVHQDAPSVPLATVSYRSMKEIVGVPTQTRLSFLVSGVVGKIEVGVGDHVWPGEPLAQIDVSRLSLSAQQAEANARAAAASEQQAHVDRTSSKIAFDRMQLQREVTLFQAGVAARKEIEAVQAQLAADRAEAQANIAQGRSANAQFESAAVEASLAQEDLANATLRSFSPGVVVAIFRRPGESVDPSTPVLAVSSLPEVVVRRGLIIPLSAVVQDPQSGQTLVFVQQRDDSGETRFVQRSVRIAFNNGSDALVTSGLRGGERIAAEGAFALLAPAGSGE